MVRRKKSAATKAGSGPSRPAANRMAGKPASPSAARDIANSTQADRAVQRGSPVGKRIPSRPSLGFAIAALGLVVLLMVSEAVRTFLGWTAYEDASEIVEMAALFIVVPGVGIEALRTWRALSREMAERDQAEEELRESEERYEDLYDNAPAMFVSVDATTAKILRCNQTLATNLGYAKNEIVGRPVFEVYHPDSLDGAQKAFRSFVETGEVRDAELQLRRRDGSAIDVSLNVSAVRDSEGRIVYSRSVWRDITEHRRADQALRESEERFRLLAENAQDVILRYRLTEPAGYEYISPVVTAMSGYAPAEWYENPHLGHELVHPDDRQAFERMLGNLDDGPVELRWICKDSSVIWTEQRTTPIRDDSGKLVAVEGVLRDITSRKKAEQALRESEEHFRALAKASPVGIFRTDVDGNCVYVNDRWCEIAGLPMGKALREGWVRGLHPDDRERVAAEWYRSARGERLFQSEYRFQMPDGTVTWVLGQATSERDVNGDTFGYVGTITDITKRKQAEEALRESEAKYHDLVETSQDLIWRCDGDGRFTYLNPAWERTHGYRLEEMLGRPFTDFERPEVAARDTQEFASHFAGGSVAGYETTHLSKSGEEVQLVFNAIPLFGADGNIVGTQGTAYDITARKRAEEALRLRSAAVDAAANGIVVTDREGNIVWVNAAFTALTGYPFEEAIGQNPRLLKSGNHDQPFYQQLWDTVLAGQVWRGEMINRRKDGSFYTEEQTITPVSDERGEVTHFIAIKQDVTARKQADEALIKQQQEQQIILDSVPGLIFYKDRENRFLRVNRALIEASGIPKEAWEGGSAFDLFPEQAEDYWRDDKAVLESGQSRRNIIEPMETPDGTRWYRTDKIPYRDADGQIIGVIGFSADITEQLKAEETLQHVREELEGKAERSLERGGEYGLTFREMTVLHLVAEGKADKEIAAVLGIRPLTVSKHVSRILGKMEAHSRTEAGTRAVRKGLLG